ncbi:thiamine-phosphate kinase [Pseudomonas syringae]|uniref:thiamine-phosphate kinase n=1 Tax=Pseudomonas syringae TaxID=317 RepID=UPI003F7A3B9C
MVTMSKVGEKAFLKALLPTLKTSPEFINGFGHDASIIDLGLEELLAFKIDRAPFPVSVHRGLGDYRTWGRLAVVANVSDLLAVGAKPRAFMLSIVVPGSFDADDVRDIISGCEEACAAHQIVFLGGDTKEGAAPQVIGSALGTLKKECFYGRGSASPGDYLFIAGRLGGFGGAVALMDATTSTEEIPQRWIDVLTSPSARINEGAYLRDSRSVVAACDLSDGLTEAINIFCADGAGICIHEAALPMDTLAIEASKSYDVALWQLAFGVGDWAIACVICAADVDDFRARVGSNLELHEIGRFDATGRKRILDKSGMESDLPEIINEHFRQRAEDGDSYSKELMRKR